MNKGRGTTYVVYKHTTPNKKVYIGVTSQNVKARWAGGHGYDTQRFGRAIKKYGWENITHEILVEGLTQEEAIKAEQSYIAQYDSCNPRKGYNVSPGGDVIGVESRKKISESNKRAWQNGTAHSHPQSEESKRKISETKRGKHFGGIGRKPKPVACISTGETFQSIPMAAKAKGLKTYTSIYNCCAGITDTAYGYKWQYAIQNN